MPPKFLIGVLITAAFATGLAGVARAQDTTREIRVSGLGQVEAPPDMAVVTIGVTHEEAQAALAMGKVSTAMAAVLEDLRAIGISGPDLQTRNLQMNPVWSNRVPQDNAPPRITGYAASNTLSIRVNDLDRLGQVLDAVLANGANRFNGLRFGIKDTETLRAKARTEAVKNAMDKAQQLATAAELNLGEVISISEGQTGTRPVPVIREAMASGAGDAVAAGEMTVSVAVNMVFEIDE